ncbi:MAG TPA: transposase [Micromonosporaceae bacterium]|nr:transposase [Micromonosporaceae bacterium]
MRRDHAVLAFDLAADKQVCVVADHDSRVLARRSVMAKAWQLRQTLEWGLKAARAAGFASVVVACEPTGHRWRVLDQTAAGLGLTLVCVQPLLVHRAREAEDFTRDKSDDKDALIIARLVTELRCYLPERADARWARLRHLGARRYRLLVAVGAARQQVRDLLECAWPAALGAAADPLQARNWLAALAVICRHVGASGDLGRIASLGFVDLAVAVRAELADRHAGTRWYSPIVRALFAAATDAAAARVGVHAQRAGALERVGFALADLAHARAELAEVEARMCDVLDELDLTGLAASIPGLSVVGAAAILAECGDPARLGSARALVKHAGLCPRANESGAYAGKTTISGRGRPRLRTAAWRAVFAALRHNPVLAARHQHLITRTSNPLADGQARAAVAASLLRQLHAVLTTRVAWNPATAAGLTTHHQEAMDQAA